MRGGGGGEPGDGVGREVHDVNTLLQKQVARLKLAVGDSVLEWKSRGEASQQYANTVQTGLQPNLPSSSHLWSVQR